MLLGDDAGDVAAPLDLPIGEPVGDAQEARPPQRLRLRARHQRQEMLAADLAQFARGMLGQSGAERLREIAERIVDRRSPVGGRQRHVDGFERRQAQDVLRIDRVGIAQPILDRGDRQLQRPCRARRPWRRLRDRRDGFRPVEFVGVVDVFLAGGDSRVPAGLAGDGLKPVQKARRHRRRAADLGGVAEDHVAGAEQLREVMRGQADAALRQIELEFVTHRPAQPRVDPRRRRPDAFDQPADDDAVVLRQPRFERAVDPQFGVGHFRPPHGPVAERGVEHFGVVVERHHQAARGDLVIAAIAEQFVEGAGQGYALMAVVRDGELGVVARQRRDHVLMPRGKLGKVVRLEAVEALQRRQRALQLRDQLLRVVESLVNEPGARLGRVQRGGTTGFQFGEFMTIARKILRQACALRFRAGAAQQRHFQRLDLVAPAIGGATEPQLRMLQQREQGRGLQPFGGGFRRQSCENAVRRVHQGVAAGIVELQIPASQRRHHAARQCAVGGHQRRGKVEFARLAHRHRNRQRFHFRIGRSDHREPCHAAVDCLHDRGLGQPLVPLRGRIRWPHQFGGQQFAAGCSAENFDVAALDAEPRQQPVHRELRMVRRGRRVV